MSLKYDVGDHGLLTMVAFMRYFGAKDKEADVGFFVYAGQEKKVFGRRKPVDRYNEYIGSHFTVV